MLQKTMPYWPQHFTIFEIICYSLYIVVVPIFPPWHPEPNTPDSLRQSPHHCTCPWDVIGALATPFPIWHFTYPRLFCNSLFLLTSITSSAIHHTIFQSGSYQIALHIHGCVSLILWYIHVYCHFIVHSIPHSVASNMHPNRGSKLQPRYVHCWGIEPQNFWCMGRYFKELSHLARAV